MAGGRGRMDFVGGTVGWEGEWRDRVTRLRGEMHGQSNGYDSVMMEARRLVSLFFFHSG